jgi:hypothetical protein
MSVRIPDHRRWHRLKSIGAAAIVATAVMVSARASFAEEPNSPAAAPPEESAPATADREVPPPPDRGRPMPRQRFKPAAVLTTVKLRGGPGTSYDVLDVIPAGATVGVASCSEGWCEAIWKGRKGFAISGALRIGGPGVPGTYAGRAAPPGPGAYNEPGGGPEYMGPPPYYYYGGPGYYWGPGPYWGWGPYWGGWRGRW